MQQILKSRLPGMMLTAWIACAVLAACVTPPTAPAVTLVTATSAPVEAAPPAAPAQTLAPEPTPSAAPAAVETSVPTSLPPHPVVPAILKMMDEQTGWMVKDDGRTLRTTSGMKGWKDVTPAKTPLPEPGATVQLPAAYFLSASNAWLAYASPDNAGIMMLRTRDGGATWWDDSNIPVGDFGGMVTPVAVQFINTQNGWLWAQIYPGMNHVYPALYHTTDGGQNWELAYDPSPSAEVPNDTLKASYSLPFGATLFTFIDTLNGFAGTGLLLATHDGGKTWAAVNLSKPSGLAPIKSPYVYVAPPVFTGSKDGVVPVYIFEYDSVYSPPGDMFTDLPGASYLAWTHNGGQSWKSLPMPGRLGTIGLVDGRTAWFLGKSDPDPSVKPSLYLTQDGGESWLPWGSESPLPMGSALHFTGRSNGYAIAPLYGAKDMFKKFDARLGESGYLYQLSDWSAVDMALPQP